MRDVRIGLDARPPVGRELSVVAGGLALGVDLAREQGDPQLLSGALIALAEATLEAGDAQGAVTVALEAQGRFERSGQQDSEWRAWMIAAGASRIAAKKEAMRDYASRANSLLSDLQQKWGVEAYNAYLTRPDIQTCRTRINQMLAVN